MLKCDEVTIGCMATLLIVACFVMGFSLNGWAEYCGAGFCKKDKMEQTKKLKVGSVSMFTVSGAVAILCVLALVSSLLNKRGMGGVMDDVLNPYM